MALTSRTVRSSTRSNARVAVSVRNALVVRGRITPAIFVIVMVVTLPACGPSGNATPAVRSSPRAPSFVKAVQPAPPTDREISAAQARVIQNTRDAVARYALASLYERAGRLPASVPHYIAASRLKPSDPTALRRLAEIYRLSGYLDREIEALRSVARIDSSNWRASLRLSRIYQDLSWFDPAKRALDAATAIAPQEKEVLLARATFHFSTREIDEMSRDAQEALSRNPDDPTFLALSAEAFRLMKKNHEAEQALRRAIAEASDPAMLTRDNASLAHLLLDPGWNPPRFAEAEAAARAALEQSPGDVEASYWLGRALELEGRTGEAAKYYLQATRRDIRFESVAMYLGRIYSRSSDPKQQGEGARLLRIYRDSESSGRELSTATEKMRAHFADPPAHIDMARWYARIGQMPQAIVELRMAMQLGPNDMRPRKLLVKALRAAGRISEARDLEGSAIGRRARDTGEATTGNFRP